MLLTVAQWSVQTQAWFDCNLWVLFQDVVSVLAQYLQAHSLVLFCIAITIMKQTLINWLLFYYSLLIKHVFQQSALSLTRTFKLLCYLGQWWVQQRLCIKTILLMNSFQPTTPPYHPPTHPPTPHQYTQTQALSPGPAQLLLLLILLLQPSSCLFQAFVLSVTQRHISKGTTKEHVPWPSSIQLTSVQFYL